MQRYILKTRPILLSINGQKTRGLVVIEYVHGHFPDEVTILVTVKAEELEASAYLDHVSVKFENFDADILKAVKSNNLVEHAKLRCVKEILSAAKRLSKYLVLK